MLLPQLAEICDFSLVFISQKGRKGKLGSTITTRPWKKLKLGTSDKL